jgi:hypothetical protein
MKTELRFVVVCGSALICATSAIAEPCKTDERTCRGKALFENKTHAVQCYSIFPKGGGISNFCLKPRETNNPYVYAGDTYCFTNGDRSPRPHTCARSPIPVPKAEP